MKKTKKPAAKKKLLLTKEKVRPMTEKKDLNQVAGGARCNNTDHSLTWG